MPYLSGITIYPVKSLNPISVTEARIVEGGGLAHDREFAFFDDQGKFVNGKRTPKVHALRASIDWKDGILCLQRLDTRQINLFHLQHDRAKLDTWLSEYFEMPVHLDQNTSGGFPDDKKAPGPTLIGNATLEEIARWYDDQITLQELKIRFRANLEISDCPPFWEDCLFAGPEETLRFQIGDVSIDGTNPCQRCIVPTRDSQTGEAFPEFSQIFRQKREQTLPSWANATRFNHFYRLAVNTIVPESEIGKVLRVGDEVRLAG